MKQARCQQPKSWYNKHYKGHSWRSTQACDVQKPSNETLNLFIASKPKNKPCLSSAAPVKNLETCHMQMQTGTFKGEESQELRKLPLWQFFSLAHDSQALWQTSTRPQPTEADPFSFTPLSWGA